MGLGGIPLGLSHTPGVWDNRKGKDEPVGKVLKHKCKMVSFDAVLRLKNNLRGLGPPQCHHSFYLINNIVTGISITSMGNNSQI